MRTQIALLLTALAVICLQPVGAVNSTTNNFKSPYEQLTVGDIVDMNARELAQSTGQKLSLKERIAYGFVKQQLKRELRKGTISINDTAANTAAAGEKRFNVGAFILGLLLGLIGLVIVLLAFKDKQAWKSALYGWAAFLIVYLLIVLV